MMHYDNEFRRQRQRERMAEIRAEYQRAQAASDSKAGAAFRRWTMWAWSRRSRASARRAPAFRA